MTVEGTEPPACQTVSSWTCNHLQCTLKESPREIMPRTLQNIFLNSRRIKYKKCLQENPYICIKVSPFYLSISFFLTVHILSYIGFNLADGSLRSSLYKCSQYAKFYKSNQSRLICILM